MDSALALELGEGLAVRWDESKLAAPTATEGASTWELDGAVDWERFDLLRVISAAFADGGALAIASLAPKGRAGHGDETVRALLTPADGESAALAEALLSTEYDAAGVPRRIGLELYAEPDSAPRRVAADRIEARAEGTRQTVRMAFRMDGVSGTGLYELLRRS